MTRTFKLLETASFYGVKGSVKIFEPNDIITYDEEAKTFESNGELYNIQLSELLSISKETTPKQTVEKEPRLVKQVTEQLKGNTNTALDAVMQQIEKQNKEKQVLESMFDEVFANALNEFIADHYPSNTRQKDIVIGYLTLFWGSSLFKDYLSNIYQKLSRQFFEVKKVVDNDNNT